MHKNHNAPHLIELIKTAPTDSGVYRFIDNRGNILYIGKAKNIKARLNNHLTSPAPRISHMLLRAKTITWVVTETEKQALFLEAESIEHIKPPYNIQYKDGKRYCYMHLSNNSTSSIPFPSLYYDYRWSNKAYGPFDKGVRIRTLIETVCKIFKFRTCSDSFFKARKRPCMEYDLGRCSAPCVGYINTLEYQKNIDKFNKFFHKNDDKLLKNLQKNIKNASKIFEFERAELYHKQYQALTSLQTFIPEQLELEYGDFFIKSNLNEQSCIHICGIREGKVKFKTSIICQGDETLPNFILRWKVHHKIYPSIFILAEQIFTQPIPEHNVHIYNFEYPKVNKIIENMLENSQNLLKQEAQKEHILHHTEQELGLEKLTRIEIYDNSHMQGKWNVGVGVVWERDVGFKYKEYMIFKHAERTNDDYKMMKDMFACRFSTATLKKHKQPDLVIIDGGVGQLSCASAFIPVPHFALSKHEEADKLHSLKGQVTLSNNVRLFLMKLRDEAHRFAVEQHTALKNDFAY